MAWFFIFVLAMDCSIATAQIPFAPPLSYDTSYNASSDVGIRAADLNGDGLPEIVVPTANGLVVFMNKGDGTLAQPPLPYGSGSLLDVEAADFNGDGWTDVVMTSGDGIDILLNTGNAGILKSPVHYSGGGPARDLAVGDFYHSGRNDVMLLGYHRSLFKNQGDGTFIKVFQSSDRSGIRGISADVNHDDYPDLIWTGDNNLSMVSVFINLHNGTFAPPQDYVGYWATSVAAADFNGDGSLDLVLWGILGRNYSAFEVMLNKGDGTFAAAVLYDTTYSAGSWYASGGLSLALADFDGDGKVDMALGEWYNKQIQILAGNGDGTFNHATTTIPIPPPFLEYSHFGDDSLIATDLDLNGAVDLVAISSACYSSSSHDFCGGRFYTFFNQRLPPKDLGLRLSMDHGGNGGSVTLTIFGKNFSAGDTVKLVCGGQPDIIGSNTTLVSDGKALTTILDLTGAAPGQCSVVITQPDGITRTVPKPFTIEEGGAADVWVDVVGFSKLRGGKPQTYYIVYGNRGNLDSKAVRLWISFPTFLSWDQKSTQEPGSQGQANGTAYIAFDVSPPAGFSGLIPISLTAPSTPDFAHRKFQIKLWSINSVNVFEIGDLLYRKGFTGHFQEEAVGHAGIFIGYFDPGSTSAMVVESVPDSENPPGVRVVTFDTFVSGNPYYGNRTTVIEPTADQRRRICLFAKSRVGLPYDGNHLNQKGPLEFDCVGLTELVYELVGLNPTPDSFETGAGWPLTPKEQYEHTVPAVSLNPEIRLIDSDGNNISDGGTTSSQNLTAYVTDQAHGSGLKSFKLLKDNPSSGQVLIDDSHHYEYDAGDFIDSFGIKWKQYSLPSNLPDGTFYIRSRDRAGNGKLFSFIIDLEDDDPEDDVPPPDGEPNCWNRTPTSWVWSCTDDPPPGGGRRPPSGCWHWVAADKAWVRDRCGGDDPPLCAQQENSSSSDGCSGFGGEIITPNDPNDKAGSQGAGPQQYISGATPLRYAIQFENKPTASAAAQTVVVTDQLDIVNEDLSTFSLGPISVANQLVTPPPFGAGDFSTTLDLRPDNNLLLAISTHLDTTTGLLTWTFQSLDPTTNQPPEDPEAGFLPPGAGGSMFFTVMPKEGLATDTPIQNFATIVFDANAPMDTPTWLNTIDNTAPTSHVLPLPLKVNPPGFTVQWAGNDVGAGVQDYSIFVSQDGGEFAPFLTDTTATSAVFPGEPGAAYAFYSIARDLTGNREVKVPAAEANTAVARVLGVNSTGAYFLDGNNRDSVAMNLSYDMKYKTQVTGSLKLNAITPAGRMAVQTTATDDVTMAADGTVNIKGKCAVNSKTGYSFDATMKDVASPGANKDQFSIKITGPNNFNVQFLNKIIAGGDIAVSWQ